MSRSNSPKRRRSDPVRNPDLAVGYCPNGGKRSYGTKSQAKRQLKKINKRRSGARSGDRAPETYAYMCRACGLWHLTSGPQAA